MNSSMILPYSDCLKSPRRESATDQMNEAMEENDSDFAAIMLLESV